jgi:GT2 family glycosyltransferase
MGERRIGQAGSRNVLMKTCGTEFGIMLEDDVYFLDPGPIEAHIRNHANHPQRAVIQFKCRSKGNGDQSPPEGLAACELPSFLGGASLFHIPSIQSVGGYRDFFVYAYEEPDLAMRLWGQGYRIWYDPEIFVEHNQWYSPNENRDYQEYDQLYARNSVLLATMNMPLYLGFPIGLARSVRRAFYHRRNFGVKVVGLLQGIGLTFVHWNKRTPLTLRNSLEYWQFSRKLAKLTKL